MFEILTKFDQKQVEKLHTFSEGNKFEKNTFQKSCYYFQNFKDDSSNKVKIPFFINQFVRDIIGLKFEFVLFIVH